MATGISSDQPWANLVDAEEGERSKQMVVRYTELATLPEDARRQRLLAMAKAEYALPDDKLRTFTASRIRTWLDLDSAVVQKIAASYDAVMDLLPGTAAMRRVSMVQTVARRLPIEEQDRLRALLPTVFADRPRIAATAASRVAPAHVAPAAKRPWWAFWKRS